MRKRRTRQHIIEDLGFNHVERHILLKNIRKFVRVYLPFKAIFDSFAIQNLGKLLN